MGESKKKPRIVIEEGKEGIRLKVDGCESVTHALYLLGQTTCMLALRTDQLLTAPVDGQINHEFKEEEESVTEKEDKDVN